MCEAAGAGLWKLLREEWISEGISTKKEVGCLLSMTIEVWKSVDFIVFRYGALEKDEQGKVQKGHMEGGKLIWKRVADPNIPVGLDGESYGDLLYNMLEYENIYFSKTAFAAKLYVGENGLFLLIPTSALDLSGNEKEKVRLKKVLGEVREVLGLEMYLYPVFVGEYAAWYWTGMGEPVEIEDLPMFLSWLYEASCYEKLSPINIAEKVKEISGLGLSQGEDAGRGETITSFPNLNKDLLQDALNRIEELNGKGQPSDRIRIDASGTEWVLRDSDVKIAGFSTGLIGRKAWFRVSDVPTEKVILSAVFGGCLGLHQFLLGNFMQGFFYLLTCGFGGILPAVDILLMVLGVFHYEETSYFETGEEGRLERRRARVYLKKPKNWFPWMAFVGVSLAVGLCAVRFLYRPLLEYLGIGLGYLGSQWM